MIEIALNDVHIDFGFRKVLDGASFEIQTGEKAAIIGANGSGKTTLLRLITGAEKCDSGLITVRKGATTGYLRQESDVLEGGMTVEEFLKDAQRPIFDVEQKLRDLESRMSGEMEQPALDKLLSEYNRLQNQFIAMSGYETEESFSKICGALKIDGAKLGQKCSELSGGQKTIVKLAKVLLQAPDILLMDEPTNHIDIATLEWLEGFVRDYRGTVVIISHDRYFIDKTVRKTILLDRGKAEVYNGNYSFCLKEQERLIMLEFEQYKNRQRMVEAMKAAIKRFREWGERGNNKRMFKKAANMEKRLEKLEAIEKPKAERAKLPLGFTAGKRSGKRVLTIENLCFAYDGNVLFENARMEALFKERICLLGDNGVGKTTLVRLIMNQISCGGGSVLLGESARPGYIEQETVFDNEDDTILTAFRNDTLLNEQEARRILAGYYIYGDEVHKRIRSLSGGERVILKLAMLMRRDVNFLVLDEPTNHLDIDAKELLEESLSNYQGTLLFISHDRYFINKIATKIVSIENMTLKTFEGNYEYYLEKRENTAASK